MAQLTPRSLERNYIGKLYQLDKYGQNGLSDDEELDAH